MFDFIARPFGMLLMFFYNLFNNYGVAIIFIALIIKIILLPFQMKSKRGMMRQARLQPKIAELQKKHGTNKAKINEETMKLYKQEGINPASGCIWGFLPLPIMLAFFQVIRAPITMMMGVAAETFTEIVEKITAMGFTSSLGEYYVQIDQAQFISNNFEIFRPMSEALQRIDFSFLGLNFGLTPRYDFLWNSNVGSAAGQYATWLAGFVLFLIPFISGGSQVFATILNKKMNPSMMMAEGQGKSMNTMMMLMPLLSVYIAFITPAALGFYWTVSTLLQIVQDVFLTRIFTKKLEAEEAVKNAELAKREAEIEAKRQETERRKAEGLVVERNPNTSKRKKQKSERQEQIEKAAEWEKKSSPDTGDGVYEPSRVGNRRYARGRAYDPERYGILAAGFDGGKTIDELPDNAYDEDEEFISDDEMDEGYEDEYDEDIEDDDEYIDEDGYDEADSEEYDEVYDEEYDDFDEADDEADDED